MSTYKARKEAAKRSGFSNIKLLTTSALTAAGLLASGQVMAQTIDPNTTPTGGKEVYGDITIEQSGTITDVTQQEKFGRIDWDGFDHGANAVTNFDQKAGNDSWTFNYVTGKIEGKTIIDGKINANGSIAILHENGVVITENAEMNLHSGLVTTGKLDEATFIAGGKARISELGNGEIVIEDGASLNFADGGVAAFVAPTVKNAGVINAKIGKVAFAAGEEVAVDLYGDGLFEVVVEGELADAYLENTGEINAAGGTVQMTARAAKEVADNIINLDGVVNVASATQKGGKIVLSGGEQGTVKVSGTLDASGKDGGEITIDAANTLTTADSEIKADGEEEGGHIVLWGRENALYAGDISALGNNGFVETSGGRLGVWGDVNLSAGGQWLLDPTDITIVNGNGNAALLDDLTADVFFSPDDDGPDAVTGSPDSWVWIGDNSINAALNNGVNVTFETNAEGVNDGDIHVRSDASILKTSGADSTLTFRAHDDIIIDGSIAGSGAGKLSVVFTADYDGSGGDSNIVVNEQINLNGGDFDATAPGDFTITSAGAVNVNGGDVTIDQDGVFASANANSITTHSGGKVALNQNLGGSITNAISSIFNGGSGKSTVRLGKGDFVESVAVDRAVNIVGKGKNKTSVSPTSGNAFTIDGIINGDIAISKLATDGGTNGIKVESSTAGLNELKLNKLKVENADNSGVAVFGNSVNKTIISNSEFTDNGALASLNKGQGDILFYKHSGDIKIKNVTVEGNTGDVDYGDWNGVAPTADYGIQLFGNSDQPSGKIELENVKVSGNYRASLLGIQQHDTADITMTDVELGGTTSDGSVSKTGFGGAMFLSELSGDTVDIGNTTFNEITNKDGAPGQYIVLGIEAGSPNVDATGATFEGVAAADATVAQSFAIEDKIIHKMDAAPLGLVTWKEGEFFVTGSQVAANPAAGIQHAIDIASAGNTVHVDDSTYTEDLVIDKALKLTGHGTTLQSAGGANLITVTAADVNIDPFTFDGLGTALYGVNATGANNLVVDGNSFTGFVTANANITNSKDVSVKNNTMTGAAKGVNGDNVENIKVFDNAITGTTVAGVHIANSHGTGYNGAGKDVDIWGNTVTSAAGTGILVQNSAFATIGADSLNPFASGLSGGNKVSGGTRGILIENSDNVQVLYSTVSNVGGIGISLNHSSGATAQGNIVTNAGSHGITAFGNSTTTADNITIGGLGVGEANTITGAGADGVHLNWLGGTNIVSGNIITNAADDGVQVYNTSGLTIAQNTIDGSGTDANFWNSGIELVNAGGTVVDQNSITNSYGHGVYTRLSDGVQITTNTIDNVTAAGGVDIDDSANMNVSGNTITNVNHNAVYGNNVAGITIANNFLGTDNLGTDKGDNNINGHGVFVRNGVGGSITGNTIVDTRLDGIEINASAGTGLGDAFTISNNKIGTFDGTTGFGADNIGGEGIDVNNSAWVQITGNTVMETVSNGISINPSPNATISGNAITNVGINGIYVKSSDDVTVDNNTINGTGIAGNVLSGADNGTHGIFVADSNRTKLRTNTILNSAQRGIWAIRGNDIDITSNNNIDNSGLQAIATFDFDDVTISGNTGVNSGGQGIAVVDVNGAVIHNNTITTTIHDGIFVAKGSAASNVANNITITGNTVSGVGDNGVATIDVSGLNVSGNTIDNTTDSGIEIRNSGDAQISGNFIGTGVGSTISGDGIAVHETQNTTISNNEIDNVAKDGVHFHGNVTSKTISITDNKVTATGDGVIFDGHPTYANIDISGGSITAGKDGIFFAQGTQKGTDIDITNVKTRAGDDGIDIGLSTRADSTIDITGGSHTGNDSGIELGAIQGTVTVSNATIVGETETGIELQGNIRGLLDINGGSVTGQTDGIGSNPNNPQDGAINGGTLRITNVDVTGATEDAVETGSLFNGGTLDINGGTFNAGENGVQINGGIQDGALNVSGATINAGKDGIVSKAVLDTEPGSSATISGTTINAGEDGIDLAGVQTTIINGENTITAGHDGIRLRNFGEAWISYNHIANTGDDGIDARDGDFISIYENYIDLSGFASNAPFPGNSRVGRGADGIHIENIGNDVDVPIPAIAVTAGPGGSLYGSAVKIYDNEVANVEDDGIQVETSKSAYISNNIIGHAGDDGVDVDDVETTIIRDNKISSVEDKGITVDGGDAGRYAGIFDNRVLLAGNDGIQVENIHGGSDVELLGDDDYGYGWSVNVSGNEIAMVGDDGIEVRDSGPTKVQKNKVFMAGMGENLETVISIINTFASGSFTIPSFAPASAISTASIETPSFDWTWGEGSGINVHDVSDAYNSPNGWAADIRGNTVKYTGGHGIDTQDNDRTRIKNNNIQYAGLDVTSFSGSRNALSVLGEGPLHRDNPGRRDLWASEGSMIDVLDDYIGNESETPDTPIYGSYITIGEIEYSDHDGIHAENIYGQYFEGRSGASYLYDLKIKDNTVKFTGDDGIEVDGAGRTLIAENKIRDAGYGAPTLPGDGEYYGAGDEDGADGIRVSNVRATLGGLVPVRAGGLEAVDTPEAPSDLPVHEQPYDYEAQEGYALVIRNNDIKRTGDDGIEVVGSGEIENGPVGKFGASGIGYGSTDRVLIAENKIRETGYADNDEGEGSNVGEDGYGHDGIHVRNVTGTSYNFVDIKRSAGSTDNAYNNFYGYAVDIVKNDIKKTGDDGVEVYNSESTLIVNNTIRKAGVKDKTRRQQRRGLEANNTDGADYYGADGISVRNVGGATPYYGSDGYAGSAGFEPYSVAIVNNDIRKTADDGIEVIGEGSVIYDILSSQDDDAYKYNGTGRTLILDNVIREAGISGRTGTSSSYDYSDSEGSTNTSEEWGNKGAHDGFGGDGISVRGVGVNGNQPIPTIASGAGASGGFVDGSDYAVKIIGNDVRRTGDDGIEVVGNNINSKFGVRGIGAPIGRVLIEENFVKNAGISGGTSRNNHYNNSGSDEGGSYYENGSSNRTTLFGNAGNDGYGADGIHVRGIGSQSYGVPQIATAAGREDGSYAGYAVDIIDNKVRKTGDDGIEVRDSSSTFIAFNNVNNAGALTGEASSRRSNYRNNQNGSRSSSSSRLTWFGGSQNQDHTGGDGIHVENVGTNGQIPLNGIGAGNGYDNYAVVAYRNKVKNSADDGIEVLRSGRTRIEHNKVFNSGLSAFIGYDEFTNRRNGHTSRGGLISVGARAFDGRGSDGIHVSDVYNNSIEYFDQAPNGDITIRTSQADSVEIVGNTIDNSADDGIQIIRSGDTLIGGEGERDGNEVSNSGTGTSFGDERGPLITAIRTLDSDNDTETFTYGGTGEIDATGGDGINVRSDRLPRKLRPGPGIPTLASFSSATAEFGRPTDVRIIGNQVSDSADDGIEVDTGSFKPSYRGTTNVLIDTNDVINSGDNGIALVTGGFLGSNEINVSFVAPFGGEMNSETTGNTVENSGNNGLLAGGYNHDQVIVSDNTFTNNPTGARFESGEIDFTGDANTFTVTPDFVAPEGFDFVTGMQFELAGSVSQPTSLTIRNNTLGTTIFDGFGSRPVGQSFYVRVEDGALLEESGAPTIIDGTFANWDGLVPNNQGNFLSLQQLIDLESRIFDADDPALNGRGQIFVGTVPDLNPEDFLQERGFGQFGTSGLNIIVTGLPSTGGPTGANFNNINPAAGEGEEGGNTAEDLANLEPAAGGEEAACWGDAIDAASAGGTVSYSFGGSLQEAIADASSCGSGSL